MVFNFPSVPQWSFNLVDHGALQLFICFSRACILLIVAAPYVWAVVQRFYLAFWRFASFFFFPCSFNKGAVSRFLLLHLFCACFCYTLFCESGSWSRNKECILFFVFRRSLNDFQSYRSWWHESWCSSKIHLFFQVCFIFLHFPYYVNAKSRCLLLHLILFVFVIKTIYIYHW